MLANIHCSMSGHAALFIFTFNNRQPSLASTGVNVMVTFNTMKKVILTRLASWLSVIFLTALPLFLCVKVSAGDFPLPSEENMPSPLIHSHIAIPIENSSRKDQPFLNAEPPPIYQDVVNPAGSAAKDGNNTLKTKLVTRLPFPPPKTSGGVEKRSHSTNHVNVFVHQMERADSSFPMECENCKKSVIAVTIESNSIVVDPSIYKANNVFLCKSCVTKTETGIHPEIDDVLTRLWEEHLSQEKIQFSWSESPIWCHQWLTLKPDSKLKYSKPATSYQSVSCYEQQLLKHIKKSAGIHSQTITSLHDLNEHLKSSNTDATHVIWVIDQIRSRHAKAITGKTLSLYSVPFYTSKYGYKMCLRCYLNGDGCGKDSCVSMFLAIMSGKNDNLDTTVWPFQGSFSFSLIDIINATPHLDYTLSSPIISAKNNPSSSFQKPQSGAVNIASGIPQFAQQESIENFICYTVEDMLVIHTKITDDPPAIPASGSPCNIL